MSFSIPLIHPNWQVSPKIQALCTTRIGGVSQAPFASLNPALHVQDDLQVVQQNRTLIESFLPAKPLWLSQQHTTDLLYYSDSINTSAEPVADAAWTDKANQPCVVMTADCMPVLLCDKDGSWVAAVHAGWKGLLDGIIEHSLLQILAAKKTSIKNVQAWIGPAISQANFEVGAEVREQFVAKHGFAEDYFLVTENTGKYLADLNGIAEQILRNLGVLNVELSRLCTYAEPERFYSYRYACHHPDSPENTGKTGRLATIIWLQN
jgi:hypothetical protein